MKKIILLLIFLLNTILSFAEKLTDLPEILRPDNLIVDGDRFYITSGELMIYAYSTVDYKFIKQFVKQGEGPAEAALSIKLKNYPNFLTVEDYPKKIMYFSKYGDYIKEKRIPANLMDISCLSDNFLGKIKYIDDKKQIEYFSINLMDNDFNPVKLVRKSIELEIFTSKKTNKKKIVRPCGGHIVYRIYNNRIYITDTNKGFIIIVFDNSGKQLYEIKKEYKKVRVPQAYIDNIMNKLKKTPIWDRIKTKYRYIFPKYFTAIKNYWVINDKIYVLTHEKKEGKEIGNDQNELVILDLKGNFLKSTFVPDIDLCTICNDRYYYLLENEDKEIWELHAEKLK